MLKIPLYSKKKLILAFEYAIVMSNVAKEQKVDLTMELVREAEEMILNEFHKSPTKISVDMLPNILSIFKTK